MNDVKLKKCNELSGQIDSIAEILNEYFDDKEDVVLFIGFKNTKKCIVDIKDFYGHEKVAAMITEMFHDLDAQLTSKQKEFESL